MIFGCVLYDTSLNPSIIIAGFLKESLVIQSIVWSCVGNEAGQCSEETAVFKIFYLLQKSEGCHGQCTHLKEGK